MLLPNTATTFHALNCFGHVIYVLWTIIYKNIAKLLTQPIDILLCFCEEYF